jgi:uncharacterized protein YndB with AHSA1/START domain
MPNRNTMPIVDRVMSAPPEQVWDVLADGWLYPVWVVGATHMRDVDEHWPAAGARLHHQVGAWPLALSDTTRVLESDEPRRLVLEARAWPTGEARIEITVEPHAEGSLVRLAEGASAGPARVLDNPLQRRVLRARNVESLSRLAAIVENRHAALRAPSR